VYFKIFEHILDPVIWTLLDLKIENLRVMFLNNAYEWSYCWVSCSGQLSWV